MVNGVLTAVSEVSTPLDVRSSDGWRRVNAQDKWTQLGEMLPLGIEGQVDIPLAERGLVRDRLVTDLRRAIDDTRLPLGDGTLGGPGPKQAGRLVQHRLLRRVERVQVAYRSREVPGPTRVARDGMYGSPAPATRRGGRQSRSEKVAEWRHRSRPQR